MLIRIEAETYPFPMRTALAILTLPLLALAGCVNTNARTTVGDSVVLPAFTEAGVNPRGLPPTSAPSLEGMDRSNWSRQVFVVPVDGPEYRPLYATQLTQHNDTVRQRLEFPSPTSALELSRTSQGEQMGDAAASAGYAFWDLLAMVPRMCMTSPWSGPQRGDVQPYWRAPVSEARATNTPTSDLPEAASTSTGTGYTESGAPASKMGDPAAAYNRSPK